MADDTTPRRVQLRRLTGWRMPEHTKKVARPTRWGNPWAATWQPGVGWCCIETSTGTIVQARDQADAHDLAVSHYRRWIEPQAEAVRAELRGWNLACFCAPPLRCHADVLLEVANA